jgi:hypothetical protein
MEPRPIREEESRMIEAALRRAPKEVVDGSALAAIPRLVVVDGCKCGCASVDFDGVAARSRPLADGIGETPRGGQVGVIVWGSPNAITGLEVYDLGAGDGDLVLPKPETIVPWERT